MNNQTELNKTYFTAEKSQEIKAKMDYLEEHFGKVYFLELGDRIYRKNGMSQDLSSKTINIANQTILDIYDEWVGDDNKIHGSTIRNKY